MASADRTSPSNGPPATNISSDRFQFHHVRSELERAVRFVNDHETTRTMACHHHLHSWEPHHSLRVHTTTDDENEYQDFDGIGMDDASGLAIPAHKAASYSNAPRSSRMVPCSPPVPIPQKHRQRRNSVASMRSASSSSLFIPIQDNQYSRTQCEAQLRDEYWNYKLSLESRESFEASTTNQQDDGVRGSNINQTETPKPRADSEASTEDTTREYSGDEGTTDADPHVFDMDEF